MKTVTAEKVGLSSTRLQRISKVMQGYVDQHKLAGIITMLARRGEVVHFECFGMMDIEADKAMQSDTIFRLYSMTKPITSVAVMMLYEEGSFQLYDSVSTYIPEFKGVQVFSKATPSGLELVEPEREMTIQDLLRHTSGLTYDFLDQRRLATYTVRRESRRATYESWFRNLPSCPWSPTLVPAGNIV